MTSQILDQIATKADEDLHMAYWSACDNARRALNPADLTSEDWAVDLLAEAYYAAMQCEADPDGWDEGRAKC